MKMSYKHKALKYAITDKGIEYDSDKIECQCEMIVCPRCKGIGTHFRSDLDENDLVSGIQEDGDEDSMEAYRGGAFDQRCIECNGEKVIQSPTLPEWAKEAIQEWEEQEYESQQEQEAERRAGC